MLEIIREITLDVSEENRFTAITAKQYDSRSRYLLVRLTDRGEALTLPDTASVLISATRPDGLSDGFEGLVQDGAALVPLDYWMLMLDGTVTCELVVTGADGYRLTTMSFALDVRHSCFGDGLTPGGNHGVYVRLLHEIEDLKKKIGEGLGGSGTVTDEQIYAAVEKYLTEHPLESPEAEKAAESAKKSAEDAEAAASEAKTVADEAGESSRTANRSATSAAESASQAASSAESAESSASAAQTAKEGAETAKNEAAQQATNAGNAAQEAATAAAGAAEAKTAAQTAQQAAETAKSGAEQAATNASASAGTAAESATTAQNAAQSAVSAKEAAETAKTAAEGARDEAGQQATTAANVAQTAATAAENAEKAQTAAETAANTATSAKTAAESARDQANQSATNAANSAGTASTAAANATSAKTAAETAKGEAQTAATSAGKSATAAAGSATTASNAAKAAQTAQAATEATKAEVERKLAAGDYKGKDGVSPTVTVTSEGEATTIKVVGADGVVQTATIHTPSPQIVMHTAESMEWLEENGDKSLVYILPDDKKYGYFATEQVGEDVTNTISPKDNCQEGKKLSGSGGTIGALSGGSVTNHIPVKIGDTVTVKGWKGISGSQSYVLFYNDDAYTSDARISALSIITDNDLTASTLASNNKWMQSKTAEEFSFLIDYNALYVGTGVTSNTPASEDAFNAVQYIAISGGLWDAADQITVTTPGGGIEVVGGWQAFGSAIPTERSADIDYLLAESREHNVRIASVEEKLASENLGDAETFEDALERIKTWDKPVYDDAPVTLLGDDRVKAALTSADFTIEAIYARYRALRDDPDHPENALYITETLLGPSTTSDLVPGFTGKDILRFDFCEPVGLTEVDDPSTPKVPDPARETKPKLIFLSGIHKEWAGVYGLYYALEEIATNPDFDDIRRNAHIIVIPCANPFGLIAENTVSSNPQNWGAASHVNANGIAPHNNFGVGYVANHGVLGTYNHSGAEAYSELETQYIDAVMRENSDAIAFVTCHNYNNGGIFGDTVMWASSATYHMCNLVYRLVDKMSKAWIAKYGDTLKQAIDAVKHDVAATDYRLGCATMSTSAGTEQANATKYGILATNLEISDKWVVFSDTQFSSEAMTHGAEVYANFIRTILRAYDHKDRKEYAPTPAYTLE